MSQNNRSGYTSTRRQHINHVTHINGCRYSYIKSQSLPSPIGQHIGSLHITTMNLADHHQRVDHLIAPINQAITLYSGQNHPKTRFNNRS
nr:hypothetical protein MACL_00000608 [Theileria orientalis]